MNIEGKFMAHENMFPDKSWKRLKPKEAGLSEEKLERLKNFVGGCSCVVRHDYLVYMWGDYTKSIDVASAVKPVISTLLLFAI